MLIGDVARRAGVSHRTLHYYERISLLKPAEREGAGYRHYGEDVLKRLEKIAALKTLGLSLAEIGAVIDLYFEDDTGLRGKERVLAILQAQLDRANERIGDLTALKQDIEANIARMRHHIAEARRSGG